MLRKKKVWIHGGSFIYGSSLTFDPKVFVPEAQLIVVTINYRLSLLGFLYLDDTQAPGNQGLLDQNLAIKWVYENIANFGGDPNKITLMGTSAGSISVGFHLLSPLSWPYFYGAIMQSGSTLTPSAFIDKTTALQINNNFMSLIGCTQSTTSARIACAKTTNASKLVEVVEKDILNLNRVTWVVDNYFLTDQPDQLLSKGAFKKCPIIFGSNKNEGNLFLFREAILTNGSAPRLNSLLFRALVPIFYRDNATRSVATYKYTNWNNIDDPNANLENIDLFFGDYFFYCPLVQYADVYTQAKQSVYQFYFTQRNTQSKYPTWAGALHADELNFVFGEPIPSNSANSPSERVLSRKMIKYWSNFARFQNPNGNGTALGINTGTMNQSIENWPLYTLPQNSSDTLTRGYVNLNAAGVVSAYNLRVDHCSLFNTLIPSLKSQSLQSFNDHFFI
jgi:acetylcholinesterase